MLRRLLAVLAVLVVAVPAGAGVVCSSTNKSCSSTVSSGGGGSSAFSALTSSTNTTAAMLVGTGASLGVTGTGTIAATTTNIVIANEAGTGTTANLLAKLTGAPSTAIVAGTSDTSGIVGLVVSGAGTTGSATVARSGSASCAFDGATTAGDYVIVSTTAAGKCHDTGAATYPTGAVQVLGRVLSTNGGAGTYAMTLHMGTQGFQGSGTANTISKWTTGGLAQTDSGVTDDGTTVTTTEKLAAGVTTVTKAAVGTTSADGIVLQNTTAAANGAQQYSPRIRQRGNGWETTGGTSQTVDFMSEVRPVQGVTVNGGWVLSKSLNGAAYVDQLTLSFSGNFSTVSYIISGAGVYPHGSGRSYFDSPADVQMDVLNSSGNANAGVRFAHIVEVNTTTKAPSATENGEIYTNTGDTDGSTVTLLNDPAVGSQFCVAVDAAQTVTVAPSAGESIVQAGSSYTTSCTNNVPGSTACFLAMTGGSGAKWVFLSAVGTWTCS